MSPHCGRVRRPALHSAVSVFVGGDGVGCRMNGLVRSRPGRVGVALLSLFGLGGPFVEEFAYGSVTGHWRAVGCEPNATDCLAVRRASVLAFLHSSAVRSAHDPSVALFRYVFHGWRLVARGGMLFSLLSFALG